MSRFVYCLVYCLAFCLAVRTHYSLDALDKVESEQDRLMRRFLPLLIGVIVTPLSAAAHHEMVVAHAIDEGDTNLPVSRGRVDTGSTEQIYLMLKDGGSFSVPIPMTNGSRANWRARNGLRRRSRA